jgi:A/G-specific adenine glycosylase
MSFGSIIINWYKKNKRDLPWRHTKDPYLIWLSEIILQQTRVEQGLPYYFRFSEKYPTVGSLAIAKEDEILRLWQGLGYYTRARNLHAAARQIKNEFGNKFPTDYSNIRSLKGVGEYTAAAIASFAFDLEHAVVDGNVFRLLSRYFGIKTPIDTGEGKKKFTALAGKLMKSYPPAIFNQAIMEFGARQCRPASPDCEVCPLNSSCYAYGKNTVSKFPIKKNKVKSRNRYFNYLVIKRQKSFFIFGRDCTIFH